MEGTADETARRGAVRRHTGLARAPEAGGGARAPWSGKEDQRSERLGKRKTAGAAEKAGSGGGRQARKCQKTQERSGNDNGKRGDRAHGARRAPAARGEAAAGDAGDAGRANDACCASAGHPGGQQQGARSRGAGGEHKQSATGRAASKGRVTYRTRRKTRGEGDAEGCVGGAREKGKAHQRQDGDGKSRRRGVAQGQDADGDEGSPRASAQRTRDAQSGARWQPRQAAREGRKREDGAERGHGTRRPDRRRTTTAKSSQTAAENPAEAAGRRQEQRKEPAGSHGEKHAQRRGRGRGTRQPRAG